MPFSRLATVLAAAAFLTACDSGGDPSDTTPPTLISATISADGEDVSLVFSEDVDDETARPSAFVVNPGNYVSDEVERVAGREVSFEIPDLPPSPQVTYTVTATGIADRSGNVAGPLTATFVFGSNMAP